MPVEIPKNFVRQQDMMFNITRRLAVGILVNLAWQAKQRFQFNTTRTRRTCQETQHELEAAEILAAFI